MTLDNAGNTLSTARKLNLTSTTQTFTDFVGGNDLNDFYSLSVGSRSSLNLTLNGLSANADVRIVQDKNLNGIIDVSSEVITGSYLTGTASDSIKAVLDAGNYFIQVFPGIGANTNYNLGVSAASFSDRVLELVNLERANAGLSALKLNSQLSQAAQSHSQDMALRDYFSHIGSNGSRFSDRILATGYKFSAAAENIAAGCTTPESVVQTWMNSSGHKANILNANYKDIGIGHYYLANDTGSTNHNNYWTQNFGAPTPQPVNIAPTNLQLVLDKIAYTNKETLRVTSGWVFDGNGATDINRIDFKIKRADGTFVDTSDIFSVTPSTSDNRWGQFNYSLNLGLNLGAGNHSLWAVAYDKAGAVSNVAERQFNLTVLNIAPTALEFGLEKTVYNNTETLRITHGSVLDANGATDINRIDFKIKRADGTFVDTPDIFSVTASTSDNRWGKFNYSLNLAGLNLASGNYSLWAQAYDKAGAVSNVIEQKFNLVVPNIAPNSLQFGLEKTAYNNTETLRITNGWVFDGNGATDINRVDFKIKRADGTFLVDTADVFSFTPNTSDNRWGQFNYSLNLAGLKSGNYGLWAVAYDKAGAASNVVERQFTLTPPNIVPTSLQFGLEKTTYTNTETLRINNGWVFDGNGATDINRVDFKIKRADSTFLDTADIFSVTPNTLDNRWGQFNYSLNLAGLNLGTGNHSLWAVAYDKAGAVSNVVERQFAIAKSLNLNFSTFNLSDASGDDTTRTAFQSGALNLSYYLSNAESLSNIRLEALKNGNVISTLGSWTSINLSNSLVNLSDFSTLTGGEYQFRIVARTTTGQDFFSASQTLQILSWSQAVNTTYGTVTADRLNYSATLGTGSIFVGRGGTDTLNLGVNRSSVKSINGLSLTTFNPSSSAQSQAIFRGTAFDYLTLTDGREIYFQGIENLNFSDGSNLELQVRTNDTFYGQQWNLRVSDVDTAWRFTQGSSNVLLVSLDTGIFTAPGKQGGITDISTNRLIAGTNADDNYGDYGHGHSSVSVMSSTANNGSGIAGINWNSSVYVNDVYNGVSLQQGIRDAIAYARSRNMRVVFQGGIQGDYWLNSGGTQAELEKLIRDNSDIATFAIAAGNGGPSGNLNDPNYLTSVSGVAKLQTTHSNVISVGALVSNSTTTVNGLTNTSSVDIASYSNRGSNLTLMAATDSLAMNKFGQMQYFGGTSCANPNMAGIASLVWSVNTNLNGGQLRQILIDTAMDLGASGKDNNFGNGLVNADAAVRRALALSRNTQLANLYSGRSAFA